MAVPDEAPNDPLTAYAIQVFMLASRARRYVVGVAVAPLPLSIADVSAVVDVHGPAVDRRLLDACVLALDAEWLEGV